MHLLASIVIGIATLIGSLFGHAQQAVFGNVSLTNLNGTDNLTNFPTTYNANNTAINNGKIDSSTTSVASITTLSNLATVGTISTGVWQGTAVGAAYGGTGSTTLSANQVLLGNGTSGIKTPVGWGNSGQSLVSNGTGVAPTWQSAGVDTTQSFIWSGINDYTGNTYFKNLNASSTVIINQVTYAFTGSQGGAGTFLKNDGSGNLTWSASGLTSAAATTSASKALGTTQNNQTTQIAQCVAPKLVAGGGYSGVPQQNSSAGHYGVEQS